VIKEEYRFLISLYIYWSKIVKHSMQLTNTYYLTIDLNTNLGEGRNMDIDSGE